MGILLHPLKYSLIASSLLEKIIKAAVEWFNSPDRILPMIGKLTQKSISDKTLAALPIFDCVAHSASTWVACPSN